MAEISAHILALRPLHADTIPVWLGRSIQAWFLDSVRQISPVLSEVLHDGPGPKPFTISNLVGTSRHDLLHLSPAQVYSLRITTLHPDLTRLMLHGLIPAWLATPILLHDQPFRVEMVVCDNLQEPTSGQADYADLLTASTARSLNLTFGSPTTFKKTHPDRKTEQFQPLPEPRLVFRSLFERWNRFSPLPLPDGLMEEIEKGVTLADYRIHTERVGFERANRTSLVGFVGWVRYDLAASLSPQTRQVIQVLGEFARYSGVGIKTTVGLGQCWRTSPTREKSGRST